MSGKMLKAFAFVVVGMLMLVLAKVMHALGSHLEWSDGLQIATRGAPILAQLVCAVAAIYYLLKATILDWGNHD